MTLKDKKKTNSSQVFSGRDWNESAVTGSDLLFPSSLPGGRIARGSTGTAGDPSFVHVMMSLADGGTRPIMKVVADQHGDPTLTTAIARQLRNILAKPDFVGTFPLTSEGQATWFEFAQEIFRLAGKNKAAPPAPPTHSRVLPHVRRTPASTDSPQCPTGTMPSPRS